MAISISESFRCSILSVSIYHGRRSYIRVKSYGHLNYPRASVVQFWPSCYIMGVDHTFESKVMAVSICRDLPCSISRVSIFGARESDTRGKSYRHMYISRASAVQFWAYRYIMGIDHTFESKVMAIWTFRELPLFNLDHLVISWASLIHSSQKLRPFELQRASVVQFWASRYIMGVDHTFE